MPFGSSSVFYSWTRCPLYLVLLIPVPVSRGPAKSQVNAGLGAYQVNSAE